MSHTGAHFHVRYSTPAKAPEADLPAPFSERIVDYTGRVAEKLDAILPPGSKEPEQLHEAMRYAVLNGGKRIRPLLVYATGECLHVSESQLDAPAAAIELIHAFSLVHDDLPAMDDDDLREACPPCIDASTRREQRLPLHNSANTSVL